LMNELYENFTNAAKSHAVGVQAMAEQTLNGVEQMGQLHLAASKATVGELMQQAQSMLDVRDPQQFMAMQASMFQPMAEKSASYLRQMFEIISSTNVEIGKLAESQMKDAQQSFASLMDSAMRNAPAGTEAAASMFRNAFSASQEAINSAQNAARQAVATTEQNLTTMSDQALSTARGAAARNKR
ncbi:MAG: TIGR01841 family phasin, partial [Burkholderiales bacterium]